MHIKTLLTILVYLVQTAIMNWHNNRQIRKTHDKKVKAIRTPKTQTIKQKKQRRKKFSIKRLKAQIKGFCIRMVLYASGIVGLLLSLEWIFIG